MHIVSKLYPSLENHPELNFLLCTQDKEHDNNTVGRAKVKAAKAGKEIALINSSRCRTQ